VVIQLCGPLHVRAWGIVVVAWWVSTQVDLYLTRNVEVVSEIALASLLVDEVLIISIGGSYHARDGG
jgi:hypothetical protein